MMNKRIRSMIDDIFSDMKMTAENLALRDELLANALARYEDSVASGKTEEEAFMEVAASLGDVQTLLAEMNETACVSAQEEDSPAQATEPEQAQEPEQTMEPEQAQEAGQSAQPEEAQPEQPSTDLGDALNKAFNALGDFGQSIMPEAKKLVRQMDDATGGMIKGIGRAAQKGLRDAQKAAGEAIDRLSGEKGELVFDFGPKHEDSPEKEDGRDAAALRGEAADLRAQAGLKEAAGDQEGAADLRAQAYAREIEADAIEQAQAMEAARREAERAAQDTAAQDTAAQDTAAQDAGSTPEQPLTGADGEIDEEAFAKAVDDMTREAEEAVRQAQEDGGNGADYVVRDAKEPVSGRKVFPAAGLHAVDIQLDADDVSIVASEGGEIETVWEAQNVDGEPAVTMDGHTLTIRRRNPDVFKTFFSVIQKNGGKITVRVPRGYGAEYTVATTSGNVRLCDVDADSVKVNTTSGDVRVELNARLRAREVEVSTVSGDATVSACADDVSASTVSGRQFISCDAHKVDVNVVSGRVHVEGACDEWEVNSVSSDVELLCTVAPTKKVQISSMHGDVRLALPGDIRGFVAETSGAFGCEIVNEFGPNRYGTCALPIRMDTMRGRLMITRL